MGEWSEYFEYFPEEDPANYIDGRFAPQARRRREAARRKLSQEQAQLNTEIRRIIEKHSGKQAK